MVEVQRTTEIQRDPGDVFHFLSDMGNAPMWDPVITASHPLTPNPVGQGARWQVTSRVLGVPSRLEFSTSEYEPGRRVTFDGEGRSLRATDVVTFDPVGEGTRVTFRSVVQLQGAARLLEPLARRFFDWEVKRSLQNLKHLLETGA